MGAAEVARHCLVPLQVAATLSGIVLGSAALFAYHCANRQIWLAGLHPPLMYGLLILLLLPLPLRTLFPVGSAIRLACVSSTGASAKTLTRWHHGQALHHPGRLVPGVH